MAIRRHPEVIVDINNRTIQQIILQEGESEGTVIPFLIVDNGTPVDLTGYVINTYIIKPDGTKVLNPSTITDAANGKVEYTVTTQTVSASGRGLLNLQILEGQTIAYSGGVRTVIEYTGMGGNSESETNIFAEVITATENALAEAEGYALDALEAYTQTEQALREAQNCQTQACNCATQAQEALTLARQEASTAQTHATSAEASATEAGEVIAQADALMISLDSTVARVEAVEQGLDTKVQTVTTAESNVNQKADAVEADRIEVNRLVTEFTTAEADRVLAEQGRVTAESDRATQEQVRKDYYQTVLDNESARVNAENLRASAEQDRVSAESARAFLIDSIHNTAVADHEKYLSDQAEYENLKQTIASFEGGQIAADVAQMKTKLDTVEEGADKTDLTGYATEQFVTEQVQAVDVSGQLVDYVKKEAGKGLSTNDYTDGDKAKIDAIPTDPKYTDTVTTINGKTGAITKDDVVALGIPSQDTTYSVATITADGLMSSGDKSKLEGVEAGANKTTVINTLNSDSATSALSAAQGKALDGKITNAKSELNGNIQQLRTDLTPVMAPQETAGKPIDAKYMFDYVTAMNAVLETI